MTATLKKNEVRNFAKQRARTEGRKLGYIGQYATVAENQAYLAGTPYELAYPNDPNNSKVDQAPVHVVAEVAAAPKPGNTLLPVAASHSVSEQQRLFQKIADAIGTCSTFQRKTDNKSVPATLSREMFQHKTRANKDGKLFCPAIFNGTRGKDNVVTATGICLDFDYGTPSVEQVLELFPRTLAAYYSTHSHGWKNKEYKENGVSIPADTTYTSENPRFRVVIPLSRPIDSAEHERLVLGIKSIIPPALMVCLDESCLESSRMHYFPSCLPDHKQHAFTGYQDGKPLDVDHFITLAATLPAEISRTKEQPPEDAQGYEFTDPSTGEVHNLITWAAENPNFDIVAAVDSQYRIGNSKDGKQHIACPYEDQHTDQGKDLATFIVNASPPQYPSWSIHCMHSHCVDRDRLDFLLVMFEKRWLSVDFLQSALPAAISLKHPPYMNYCAREIAEDLQLKPLQAEEFRILLHLMHIGWVAQDGTLPDDDWTIHRGLSLSEDQWQAYRQSLVRSGWLIAEDGRLYNPMAKREYYKAQAALMGKSIGGRTGGIRTQQKRSRTP